jgi:hypothetical protein
VEKPETLLAKLKREQDEERTDEGYTLMVGYTVDAWCRFRPKPYEQDVAEENVLNEGGYSVKKGILLKQDSKVSKSSKKQSALSTGGFYKKPSAQLDINDIFGDILVYNLMMNIHLKLYEFADTDEER